MGFIRELLSKTDINSQNEHGMTVLMMAAGYSYSPEIFKLFELFINLGADVNIEDKRGYTALFYAVQTSNKYNDIEIIQFFSSGIEIHNVPDNIKTKIITHKILTLNEKNICLPTVDLLIKAGANINHKCVYGYTALYNSIVTSSTTSSLDTVKKLIKAGADVNYKDKSGDTVLFLLILDSQYENDSNVYKTAKLLLKYGAEIHMKNNDQRILGRVLKINRIDLAKLFLDYGSKFDAEHIEKTYGKTIYDRLESVIKTIEFCKNFPKQNHQLISIRASEILYEPSSLRYRLLEAKWNIDNDNFDKIMTPDNLKKFSYFGINFTSNNNEDLCKEIVTKVTDNLRFMN